MSPKRNPESAQRRLVTISVSHFCEKVRWALDRAGLDYVEEGHYPNAHYLASFWVARTPFVPILVDAGRVIVDSTAILHHVDGGVAPDARLFPAGEAGREAERLEAHFDAELGPAARLWAYWHWFDETPKMLHYAGYGTPRIERSLAPLLVGVMKRMTTRRFSVDREHAAQALDTVRALFDEVGARLAEGRRFLVGDRMTAADLTFASLAGPLLLPPEHGVPLPPLEEAPEVMRGEIEQLRKTPAGTFALRLYAEERGRKVGSPDSGAA